MTSLDIYRVPVSNYQSIVLLAINKASRFRDYPNRGEIIRICRSDGLAMLSRQGQDILASAGCYRCGLGVPRGWNQLIQVGEMS